MKTVRCVTTRSLTETELQAVQNGEDVKELSTSLNDCDAVDVEGGASKEKKQEEQHPVQLNH